MRNPWLWRHSFFLGFLFLIGAILCFAYGIYKGEVQAGLLLIFPFFIGSGILSLLGTIFLMLAIFCFAIGFIGRSVGFIDIGVEEKDYGEHLQSHEKPETSVDGILLVGPFPVIFTTKKSHILYLAILAFALAVGILLLFLVLAFFH